MRKRAAAIPKHEEYVRYAEHCLEMAKIAPDQKAHIIQREMAAEWLALEELLEK